MKYPRRSQYKHAKSPYRVRNWSEYEAGLTIRMVFHLPLRQTEGFLRCLAELLEIDLPIPDHTTLSRRLKKLHDLRFRRLASGLTARRTHDCTPVPASLEGRREWHTSSGYSKRSMVENTLLRYRTIIRRRMRSRTLDGQRVEMQLASKVLNTMTLLGMPDSYGVE